MFKNKKDRAASSDNPIHNVQAGKLIIRQGGEAKMAYLIKKGKVRVTKNYEGQEIEIADLGPPQIIGEMSIIKGYRHSATVRALEDTVLQQIAPKIINRELAQMNPIMRQIIVSLTERLYNETFIKKPTGQD